MEKLKQTIGFEKFNLKDVWDGIGYSLIYILVCSMYHIINGTFTFGVGISIVVLGMMFMAFELQDYKQDLGLLILALGEIINYFLIGTGASVIVLIAAMVLIVVSIKKGTGLLKTRNKQFETRGIYKFLFYATLFAYIAYQHNYILTNYINDGSAKFNILTTLYNFLPFAVLFAYSAYLDVFRPVYCMYNIVLLLITIQMFGTQYIDYSTAIYTVCSTAIYLKIQARATKDRLSKDLNDFEPIKINKVHSQE